MYAFRTDHWLLRNQLKCLGKTYFIAILIAMHMSLIHISNMYLMSLVKFQLKSQQKFVYVLENVAYNRVQCGPEQISKLCEVYGVLSINILKMLLYLTLFL